MKNIVYSLSFLLGLFLIQPGLAQEKEMPPQGGTPKNFSLPAKEVITLDNGLSVVLVPYGSLPKATIQVVVKTGNINEGAEEVWLCDMMTDLMKEGSTSYSAKEIANKMAGMGGNLNIGTGMHTFSLSTSVLYEFAPDAIALMADVLVNPSFPESELDRLKNDMKRSLAVSLSNPQSQAQQDFYSTLYPDHPYGRVYPTESMVDSYTVENIKSFYNAQVGAKRTTIYLAGKFNKSKVIDQIKSSFATLKEGEASSYPIAKAADISRVNIIDRPDAPQSTMYYGLPTIDPSHPDYVALDVANSILGGSFASRITSNIREDKGYTYSPYSALVSNYKTGLWFEAADVTTDVTGASIKEINYEINRLQNEPPTQEELDGIINYESGIYVLQNSTPGGIIGQLVFLDIHDLDESFLTDKVKNMHAVTPEKVQQVVKDYIRPEDMSLIVVGDKLKVKEQIEETLKQPIKE